ncbi:MAG: extracellular solute-binding protein [Alphaproteobacteria bacterium]|nr:extracellular solute-binding protein [Alphaproteobacteria bacterium]
MSVKPLSLALVGIGLSAVLFGAASAQAQQRFDGITVRVATFGGGWDKAVHKYAGVKFEELGGKVDYVTAPPRENLAKLIAAKGRPAPFDVVEMGDLTWVDTYEGGFLQKINLANIPNTKDLLKAQYDEWKVASWVTQEGVVYNTAKFKENGIPAIERYRDLLHPKLQGKVALLDITTAGAAQLLVGATLDAGGTMANIDPGLKLVKDVNAFQYWKVGAQAVTLMKAGDIWAATMHAGFAVQMKRQDMPVAFTHPKIGGDRRGLLKEGWLGVVKGTPQARAAEFFINEYISATTQHGLAIERGVVPVNSVARGRLSDDPVLKEFFLISDADVGKMVSVDFNKFNLDEATQKWTRMVGSK